MLHCNIKLEMLYRNYYHDQYKIFKTKKSTKLLVLLVSIRFMHYKTPQSFWGSPMMLKHFYVVGLNQNKHFFLSFLQRPLFNQKPQNVSKSMFSDVLLIN